MNNDTNCPRMPKKHYTPSPLRQFWNYLNHDYINGNIKATPTFTSNSKWSRNEQHYRQPIYNPFSKSKLSQTMISIHHREPCYTALVWVFFVHNRLREITL